MMKGEGPTVPGCIMMKGEGPNCTRVHYDEGGRGPTVPGCIMMKGEGANCTRVHSSLVAADCYEARKSRPQTNVTQCLSHNV